MASKAVKTTVNSGKGSKKEESKPMAVATTTAVKAVADSKGGAGKKTGTKPELNFGPLFSVRPRNFRIGGDIRAKRDMTRYVRWPRYIRIQRQRKILLERLKVPPALTPFIGSGASSLDANATRSAFALLSKYKPESRHERRDRLRKVADATGGDESKVADAKYFHTLKYGLKHVTHLIENKKPKLVLIARDVDPIELVLTLPTLCRKFDVKFGLVKSKSMLGKLVHQKTCAAVALVSVRREDEKELETISQACHEQFGEATGNRRWGGGHMSLKTKQKLKKRQDLVEAEMKKKKKLE